MTEEKKKTEEPQEEDIKDEGLKELKEKKDELKKATEDEEYREAKKKEAEKVKEVKKKFPESTTHATFKKPKKDSSAVAWTFTGLLLISFIFSIFTQGFTSFGPTQEELTEPNIQEAKDYALVYIQSYMVPPGTNISLLNVTKTSGTYELDLEIGGQVFTSYITTDKQLLFPSAIDTNNPPVQGGTPNENQ